MITWKEAKEKLYPSVPNEIITPEQNEEIRQYALSHFSEPVKTEPAKNKKQADFTIGSDRNIPMKCDICGKTFSMGQLEHDSSFGWICKKCDEEVAC